MARPSQRWLLTGAFVAALLAIAAVFYLPAQRERPAGIPRPDSAYATILYTTDTNGFLQACGCSSGQVGGLAKRATLIARLRKHAKGSVLLLDGGNLAPDLSRSEAIIESLRIMDYHAVGIGEYEETLERDFLARAVSRKLPLTVFPSLTGTFSSVPPFRVLQGGDKRIVVLCLRKRPLADLVPPLQAALRKLRSSSDWIIALSPLDYSLEQELVADTHVQGLLDMVIGMHGANERKHIFYQRTAFVPATQKGEVGVVELSWDRQGRASLSHRLEEVSEHLTEDSRVQSAVSAYYADESRRLLEASMSQQADWRQSHYEPAQQCAECHPAQLQQWRQSKHHHAVETLKAKDRLVAECLRCHSEWFRQTRSFHPRQPLAWDGVECATCHGDGIVHAALRTKETITRKVDEKTCRQCHDPQNDPKFDYASYLEKIRHW